MRPLVTIFAVSLVLVGGPTSTRAGEAEALEFAEANLPEVATLVESLRKRSPTEFERAVRDIERARTRIERLKVDSPRRAVELKRWTVRSRVQVETARLVQLLSRPEPAPKAAVAAAEERLTALAGEWVENERDRLAIEEKTLAAQLKRVRAQREKIEADTAAAVEQTRERFAKTADAAARRTTAKRKKKSAGGNPKSATAAE